MEESVTLAASARAAALKAEGRDILSLTLGNQTLPHQRISRRQQLLPTPVARLRFGCFRPPSPKGCDFQLYGDLLWLWFRLQPGGGRNRRQIYPLRSLCHLLNPGDEVIIPTPCWVSYVDQVKMVDAVPVTFQTTEANDFKATVEQLEAARTEKTKLMLAQFPSNPTGMIYSREELEAIGAWALEHDILILADDIYGRLVYNGHEFTTISSLSRCPPPANHRWSMGFPRPMP